MLKFCVLATNAEDIFLSLEWNSGHLVLVFLTVCLSVSKNFGLNRNLKDRDFIFGMHSEFF